MLGILGSGFVSPSELNMARVSQYVSSPLSKIQSKIREQSQQRLLYHDPLQLQCDGGSLKLLHCDSVYNCAAFQCNSIFSQWSIPIATTCLPHSAIPNGRGLLGATVCINLRLEGLIHESEAHWALMNLQVHILALRIWGCFAQLFQLCMWTEMPRKERR